MVFDRYIGAEQRNRVKSRSDRMSKAPIKLGSKPTEYRARSLGSSNTVWVYQM
jgi:hypothetical protein